MTDWTSPAPPLADWQPFESFLDRHESFVLTTHVNPDGDGLGSEVALALYLRGRGKRAAILNDGTLPFNYDFLERHHPIETYSPERAASVFAEATGMVILDTSSVSRLGRLRAHLDTPGLEVAVVDHHLGEVTFASVAVVEKRAAATGELLYDFLRRHSSAWTPAIAEAAYVALLTDTGSFRFANTDSEAFAMAAHLVALGVEPERVAARIFRHRHAGRLRFIGTVLRDLQLNADETIAWLEVRHADMAVFGIHNEDLEGVVDFPRTLPGVHVVALFTETENGKVKVSLRSDGLVNVMELAARFGGGGHRVAAGALISGSLAEVRGKVLEAVTGALAEDASGSEATGARS